VRGCFRHRLVARNGSPLDTVGFGRQTLPFGSTGVDLIILLEDLGLSEQHRCQNGVLRHAGRGLGGRLSAVADFCQSNRRRRNEGGAAQRPLIRHIHGAIRLARNYVIVVSKLTLPAPTARFRRDKVEEAVGRAVRDAAGGRVGPGHLRLAVTRGPRLLVNGRLDGLDEQAGVAPASG
jgi:hypothetical protein